MLRVVVGEVATARLPLDDELAVLDAILEPVETHVDGLGALLFDSVVEDASGDAVVSCDDSGRLGPTHLVESGPKGNGALGIEEGRASFSFGGRGEDVAHDASEHMEGTVERGAEAIELVRMVAEEEETRGAGAGLGLGKVGSVSVVVEDHVTGEVLDDGIRMGGCVVEQVHDSVGGGLGGAGLLGGNGAQGDQHGVVDGPGIVEENSHDLSDPSGGVGIEEGRGVDGGQLDLGSVLGDHMLVGAVRRGVVGDGETGKSTGNIARH